MKLLILLFTVSLFCCDFLPVSGSDEITISGCFCDTDIVQHEEYNDFILIVEKPDNFDNITVDVHSLNISSSLDMDQLAYYWDGEYLVIRDYKKQINKTHHYEITIHK